MIVRKLKKEPSKKTSRKRYLYYVSPAIILVFAFILMNFSSNVKAEDYTFGSENVIKGTSGSPANRNAEDGSFQTLTEANQYSDTYFSGSSEAMTYGTIGGGTFPSALDTDDSTRRNYIEANLAAASTYAILRPTSDSSPLTFTPTPTGTHYTTIDETTAGGNGDTDYITGASNGNEDTYGMSDTSGTGNFDVTIWHWSRGITTSSCAIQYGLDIGGTNYLGGTSTMTSITYANFSYTWTINPSTISEWTLAEINALGTYLYMTDANPDTRTTQLALYITLSPVADYEMQGTITYSSVLSTSQTTGFSVLCQGYRSNSENFYVQAWDYTTLAWVTKVTINSASDTDFNFDLSGWSTNHERSSGNEVKLRLIDVTGSDTTQDTLYLDLLKIKRTEVGYALEVEMTASATNTYGNQQLYIKGKTSSETFNVAVYNWDTTSWETNKISITSTSNTVYTYTLTATQQSGTQQVKIQFTDGTSYTADQVQDICSLDYVAVKWIHSDPTITLYRTSIVEINIGENAVFWLTYTDIDNEIPSYVYTHISSTDYSMTGNNSGDTTYYDGKLYALTKSDLNAGNTTYYFKIKDANSGDITTSPVALSVNTKPTLTLDGVTPSTGIPQSFTFFVTYSDIEANNPKYVKVTIDGTDYIMDYNGSGGGYHYHKSMIVGDFEYSFKTEDYRSEIVQTTHKHLIVYPDDIMPILTNPDRTPADPVYKNTELNFTVTYTDDDNDAPTFIKWREDSGTTQNISMIDIDILDTTYTDGKDYYLTIYLEHGAHSYDFYASNALAQITIGEYSITIQNRNPVISSSGNITQTIDTFLSYTIVASDPDTDTLTYELSTNATWATISVNVISGIATPAGWYNFNIWVNDSYGGSDTDNWILTVGELANLDPYFTSTPAYSSINSTFYQYHAEAIDPESATLTFDLFGNASFLSINPSTGIVSGTSTLIGNYSVNISVSDGVNTVWQNYTLEITPYTTENIDNTTMIICIVIIMNLIIICLLFILKN